MTEQKDVRIQWWESLVAEVEAKTKHHSAAIAACVKKYAKSHAAFLQAHNENPAVQAAAKQKKKVNPRDSRIVKWENLIQREMDDNPGISRSKATSNCVKKYPAAHTAYLAAMNGK